MIDSALDTLGPKLLSAKVTDPSEAFYEIMSGGLVWPDEIILTLSAAETGCLRALFRFRTGLIIGQPDRRFQNLWENAIANYPNWIGFSVSRCHPSEDLTLLYNKSKKSGLRYVKRL